MAVAIFTSFGAEVDSNGVPLSGGTVTVYDAGTTTLRSLYSNTGLSTAADNPITLDANGRHDMRYVSASAYKVVVKNSSGTTIYTRDNIDPWVPIGSGALAIANGGTGATDAATALVNLGAATTAQITTLSEEVAELAGAVGSTASTQIATGTTAQRPSSDLAEGMFRRNTTNSAWEGYTGSGWDEFLTELDIAAQSDQETGTSTVKVVSPGRQHFHKSACKAWARVTVSGSTPVLTEGYNFASVTDNGAGITIVTFTTALSSANYAAIATTLTGGSNLALVTSATTSAVQITTVNTSTGSTTDNVSFSVLVFGDI
jgi:hypothetical protein